MPSSRLQSMSARTFFAPHSWPFHGWSMSRLAKRRLPSRIMPRRRIMGSLGGIISFKSFLGGVKKVDEEVFWDGESCGEKGGGELFFEAFGGWGEGAQRAVGLFAEESF